MLEEGTAMIAFYLPTIRAPFQGWLPGGNNSHVLLCTVSDDLLVLKTKPYRLYPDNSRETAESEVSLTDIGAWDVPSYSARHQACAMMQLQVPQSEEKQMRLESVRVDEQLT